MHFDCAAVTPRIVLELAAGGIERVANGDVDILMRGMFARLMALRQSFLVTC